MEKWVIKNKKADFDSMIKTHGISEVLARLLVNRDIMTEEQVDKYLKSDLEHLIYPDQMKDIIQASNIIKKKINEHKRIRIVGDYDVDGVASTYILYTAFIHLGAVVDYEIPNRIKDGYGININIIEEAYRDGIDTIVTCDNGIAAMNQVERAKELGMTIIVTDHHDIPYVEVDNVKEYNVPLAHAVVNPKQKTCVYPFKELCGAGVAYKLIEILYHDFQIPKEKLKSLLEIVAIATVCDVMELVEENRVMVKHGLELLRRTNNLGLRALLEINNITLSKLSVYHLGFIIGPCLNASGRLDTAKKGLKLLLASTKEDADSLAKELKELNDSRKEMTLQGLEKAIHLIESNDMNKDKVLVIYINNCHESLAGIIAGRVKEKYNKPTIVLTDAEHSAKGSCRSIEQYNIYEELTKCNDLLIKYGGHPMAAGLSLSYDNIDVLRERLNQNTVLTEEDLLPKISIDVALPFGYVTEELVYELELLEPFGKGNTKPIFAERNVRILKASLLGKDNNTLKLHVINEYNKEIDAIYFGNTALLLDELIEVYGKNEVDKMFQNRNNNIKLSVTYYPSINEYGGRKSIQIIIQNYQIVGCI